MVVDTNNIKTWFLALVLDVKKFFCQKLPLWLFIVVCLVSVLFSLLVACAASNKSNNIRVNSAVVGYAEYRGHNYLVFASKDVYDGSFSVVHDPDCICNTLNN